MEDRIERIIAGDVRIVARLISDIDNGTPGIQEVLKHLYPYTGKAHIIGITGAPGVGKSTLVDQMVAHLRKRGQTVGVLAVDPTSAFTGGAILGDRIRMQRHSTDTGVYMRSLATRGNFGGLSRSTRAAIEVLDAMGKDVILVETVGVGQDEVDIARSAHTTLVVVIPGMGDKIQAIKAGILEIADVFVINKADLDGVESVQDDLEYMIHLEHRKYKKKQWEPPIVRTRAALGEGISELFKEIDRHRDILKRKAGGDGYGRKKDQVRDVLVEMVKNRLIETVFADLIGSGEFDRAVESIAGGDLDPYTACDRLVGGINFLATRLPISSCRT